MQDGAISLHAPGKLGLSMLSCCCSFDLTFMAKLMLTWSADYSLRTHLKQAAHTWLLTSTHNSA